MWANYIHWLHNLPLWGQVFVTYFLWSFAAWLPLAIWEQHSGFHERQFNLKWWQALPLILGLYYARHHYPWVNVVMSWPGRYLPHWHSHKYVIVASVILAGGLAKQIAMAVARMRASRSSYRPSVPDGVPSFIWEYHRRTSTSYKED